MFILFCLICIAVIPSLLGIFFNDSNQICIFISDEPETRDVWWGELRTEIRSHMRAMGCHAVLGYSEQTSIRDELIILSAIGTAAIVKCSASTANRHRQSSGTGQTNTVLAPLVDRLMSVDEVINVPSHRRLHVDVALANESENCSMHALAGR